MSLSDKQIKKFQILYRELLGKELDLSEAHEQAESLVREVELTYKPMMEREFKLLQKRRREMKII
ncbi:MAG: hypothetical protein WC737_03010 [Parcubacteria group bacterium]|jgi:hypothetical protein